MTKDQAFAAMINGFKITHRDFDDKEWMSVVDGKIVLKDGVKCSQSEFWRWRTDDGWNNGYEIFTP